MIRSVPLSVLSLFTEPTYRHTGGHLRGAVLARFPDRGLLHNHTPTPRSPRIRYVVEDGVPCVVGVGEGAPELLALYSGLKALPTPHEDYTVVAQELASFSVELGVVEDRVRYQSVSPWLALNQPNHRRYQEARRPEARRTLLERVLVGNLLSGFGALDVHLGPQERIEVEVESWRERPLTLGGSSFVAFDATWTGNVVWPSWLGLGKQVAKGLGRFRRQTP